MDSIDLKRPVMLKVVMTSEFRQQLTDEAEETISRLDMNLKALEEEGNVQISALEVNNPDRASQMKKQMEIDREQLYRMKGELDWKIKEVRNVDDGAEVPFRIVEGSVQIKPGDDILEKMSRTEVVIENWKVIEIRNA
ncbi:MAG: YlqD family protein [Candidatus Eremiobacteraeota bacterium]|nr:YlqD family protein [Candidatus Eremiobacteraeota bacterium]